MCQPPASTLGAPESIGGLGTLDDSRDDVQTVDVRPRGPRSVRLGVHSGGHVRSPPMSSPSTWSFFGGSRGWRTVCLRGEAVLHVIERIGSRSPSGRRTSLWVDARLRTARGCMRSSRPLSLCGPVLNVRKFSSVSIGPGDHLRSQTLHPGCWASWPRAFAL